MRWMRWTDGRRASRVDARDAERARERVVRRSSRRVDAATTTSKDGARTDVERDVVPRARRGTSRDGEDGAKTARRRARTAR